jgi:CheY-like chemotaxis protein
MKKEENEEATGKPDNFIVIDDDRVSNVVTKFIIKKHNPEADISLFTDPESALQTVKESKEVTENQAKKIILLDINMPYMSGWDFLDELAILGNSFYEQYIIYMFSSSIDKSDIERANGHVLVSGFFSKPLKADHLEIILGHFDKNLI